MLQLIAKYGESNTYLDSITFIKCEAEDSFAYLASDGKVKHYNLQLNMNQYVLSSIGMGRGYYSDDEGNAFQFYIASSAVESDVIIQDFSNWASKLIRNTIKDDLKGRATDALSSVILAKLPIGQSAREMTKAMKDYYNDLNNLFSILYS